MLVGVLFSPRSNQMSPTAYALRALDSNEKNYAITDRETWQWFGVPLNSYLLGHCTTVFAACVSVLNS